MKEQIIYEIHDPSSYYTPDGIADYSGVEVEELGPDRVLVKGATGRKGNGLYKVSVGYKDLPDRGGRDQLRGARGRGEGPPRSRDSAQAPRARGPAPGRAARGADRRGLPLRASPLSRRLGASGQGRAEVRLRVAGRSSSRKAAEAVGNEVESLYLSGPAGGGGARKQVRDIVSIASIFVPQGDIEIGLAYEGV